MSASARRTEEFFKEYAAKTVKELFKVPVNDPNVEELCRYILTAAFCDVFNAALRTVMSMREDAPKIPPEERP